ncbi:MAG: succinate dehydrogenase cytochrome b subunit [Deltaproteobacteria bacterium]|nr:succinate dehydrogenase cytochrome b subunit [Deltaproteobacteria bacterium]
MNKLLTLKLLSSVSGLFIFLFLILHILGNLKYFSGQEKLDEYALFLRTVGKDILGEYGALNAFRILLFTAFLTHIFSTLSLWALSRKQRPIYEDRISYQSTTFSSKYMALLGVVISVFVIFHILHFTMGVIHPPGFEYLKVYNNVTLSFRNLGYLLAYFVGVTAVAFHAYHGVWSGFQSLGFSFPFVRMVRKLSFLIAMFIWIGFLSVPFYIYLFNR